VAKLKKVRTKKQQDKETSARLLRTYGITLEEYNVILDWQRGVCAICHKPPTNRRLHTDHCHKFVKQKITTYKFNGQWIAEVKGTAIQTMNPVKSVAIATTRQKLKANSVRGLLCSWCNRGLRYYHDNPEFLLNASEYIQKFHTLCGA
jgi:hypothetical protein